MVKVKVITRAARVPARVAARGSVAVVVVAAAFRVLVGSPWMVQRCFQRGWSDSIVARES